MPFVPSSFLPLVVRPGAPSSLAPAMPFVVCLLAPVSERRKIKDRPVPYTIRGRLFSTLKTQPVKGNSSSRMGDGVITVVFLGLNAAGLRVSK